MSLYKSYIYILEKLNDLLLVSLDTFSEELDFGTRKVIKLVANSRDASDVSTYYLSEYSRGIQSSLDFSYLADHYKALYSVYTLNLYL